MGVRGTILKQSDVREDLKDKIGDFSKDKIRNAIASYEHFHQLPRGKGVVDMLVTSSAGIAGLSATLPSQPTLEDVELPQAHCVDSGRGKLCLSPMSLSGG